MLRIEDTDQERYVEGAVEIIYRTMEKTGLIHDEGPDKDGGFGPYVQSERMATGIYMKYANNMKLNKKYSYDILILACVAIIIGILSASLFQFIFDSLKENSTNPLFSMTFFGGLVGGVISFLIGYFLILKRKYKNENFVSNVLIIAPACITVAHAFGRIGCFFAGCCYGIETDSIWGLKFPHLDHNVYPTQLYEAIFLFILFGILFLLAYKYKFKYTFSVYLASYGIFRFLIEFIRGDDRGAYLLSLSPSQCFSICAIIISVILIFVFRFYYLKQSKYNSN